MAVAINETAPALSVTEPPTFAPCPICLFCAVAPGLHAPPPCLRLCSPLTKMLFGRFFADHGQVHMCGNGDCGQVSHNGRVLWYSKWLRCKRGKGQANNTLLLPVVSC